MATIRDIWPNILLALSWIDNYGDSDGDGFVETIRHSSHGLVQQGWKDSWDSVSHSDGSLPQFPLALCEVQGYVYAAKLAAASLATLNAVASGMWSYEGLEQAGLAQHRGDERECFGRRHRALGPMLDQRTHHGYSEISLAIANPGRDRSPGRGPALGGVVGSHGRDDRRQRGICPIAPLGKHEGLRVSEHGLRIGKAGVIRPREVLERCGRADAAAHEVDNQVAWRSHHLARCAEPRGHRPRPWRGPRASSGCGVGRDYRQQRAA